LVVAGRPGGVVPYIHLAPGATTQFVHAPAVQVPVRPHLRDLFL
jgi:hypothetical protein